MNCRRPFAAAALATAAACTPGGSPDAGPAPVEAICTDGTAWSDGTEAFADATERAGLVGVEGVRLAAVDYDGDGFADLLVRRGGMRRDGVDGVRTVWLMRNRGDGTFEDVTEASGILSSRGGGGARPFEIVAFADVDDDGDLDLYTGANTTAADAVAGETSELLLNEGGAFTLSDADDLRRTPDVVSGASFVDFDRDGHVDLFVGQHNYAGPTGFDFVGDRLYRGDGAGGFVDVTDDVGLTSQEWQSIADLNEGLAHTRTWATAACDLDDDGLPELLTSSYGRSPNHLWRAVRRGDDVVYENESVASGYAYDEDRTWTDNQFARCFCQANPAAEGCAGVPAPSISCADNWSHDQDREAFRLGGNSGTTVCGDVDADGDLDLLTTEIKHWWAGAGADASDLLLNDGDATFTRPGRDSLGLVVPHASSSWDEGHMTAALFDFDNDARLDVSIGATDYPGNHHLLYRQRDDAFGFVEVPAADGIDHPRSHGVAIADFDRDGDLDVVVGHSLARCGPPDDCLDTANVRYFENVIGQGGNFVQLALQGKDGSNRAAIGARVRVTTGDRTQTFEVGGGHGHYGIQHDLVVHAGLGTACEAQVEVRWPDGAGTTQTFDVVAGHRFRVVQGDAPVVAD